MRIGIVNTRGSDSGAADGPPTRSRSFLSSSAGEIFWTYGVGILGSDRVHGEDGCSEWVEGIDYVGIFHSVRLAKGVGIE